MRRRASGFTLIDAVISMGLVSILALAVFSLQTFMNEGKNQSNSAFQADQFRKDIVGYLMNQTAWRYTLNYNATFNCITGNTVNTPGAVVTGTPYDCGSALNNGPPSISGTGAPTTDFSVSVFTPDSTGTAACVHGAASCHGGFDVYNQNGNKVYGPAADSHAGFQFSGALCGTNLVNGATVTSFAGWTGTASGNSIVGSSSKGSECPFRLVLYWYPACPSTSTACGSSPTVHVYGYLLYAPNPSDPYAKLAPNPANYGVNLLLPPDYQIQNLNP